MEPYISAKMHTCITPSQNAQFTYVQFSVCVDQAGPVKTVAINDTR